MARFGFHVGLALAGLGLAGACASTTTVLGTGGSGTGGSGTGGSGSGATAGHGGAGATGGTATGGSSTGGTGTGGGGTVPRECSDATACQLVDDCCTCEGLPAGEPAPPCGIPNCFVNTCTAEQLTTLAPSCQVGRCVAGFDCDPSTVVCMTPTPVCNPGETPSVHGACWGPCVPATQCGTVGSCAQCDPATQVCVTVPTQLGMFHHCVERPSACGNKADCACMGSSVCATYEVCADGAPDELVCNCPTC